MSDAAEFDPAEVHPLCRQFELATVSRNSIRPAAYNPRHIGANERVKLKGVLKRFKMVEPLVWNRRTGNLVGGHQRLSIMDEEIGRDHSYMLTVSVCDMDLTREKELNLALNNPSTQGVFDPVGMYGLLDSTPDLDIEAAGFDKLAVKASLIDLGVMKDGDLPAHFGVAVLDDAVDDADKIRAMKDIKKEYVGESGEMMTDGYYLMVIFRVPAEKEKFCDAIGVSRYAKEAEGRVLAVKFGIDIGWEPPADPPPRGGVDAGPAAADNVGPGGANQSQGDAFGPFGPGG